MFDAGAEQSLGPQYDYTHTIGHPSSHQYSDNLYSADFQRSQQTSTSYQNAPTSDWSLSGSYGHPPQPSISYSSSSSHQYAAATASSSSSQPAPKAKLPSKKRAPAVSASHSRLSEDEAKMRSMIGRVRLPIGSMPTEAPSGPSASTAGDKRKDRTSPLPDAIGSAEPRTSKKARSTDVEMKKALQAKRAKEAERVQSYRDKQSEHIARLAEKLPDHLRLSNKDGPSPQNVRQAIIHIDEQSARIGRLESENAHLKATYAEESRQAQLRIHGLVSECMMLKSRMHELELENHSQRHFLAEKDETIARLEANVHTSRAR